jgi:poly-gamma-glutamate synthesis protein (capsule biosynthesis protein)
MQIHSSKTTQIVISMFLLMVSCTPYSDGLKTPEDLVQQTTTVEIKTSSTLKATLIKQDEPLNVWISPTLPQEVKQKIKVVKPNLTITNQQDADISIGINNDQADELVKTADIEWIYALVTPFSTNVDSVSLSALRQAWRGNAKGKLEGKPLLLSKETLTIFEQMWGEPGKNAVSILPDDEILDTAWENQPSWAIIPFSELEPRWKVIRINGKSPLDDFLEKYPLSAHFPVSVRDNAINYHSLPARGISIPATNRDREKLTILVMTGTTALVRHTALRMEEEGVTYPGSDIRDWLREADLTHISNEVSFWSKCPPANPVRLEMRFCSDPKYLELLNDVGMDFVELTGNHLQDWGNEPLLETLDIYRENNIPYYGGGRDLKEAQEPLKIEHHGNKLVFLGCNAAGPIDYWATDKQPGPAPCELDELIEKIIQLKAEGYIPIVTFQHIEVEDYKPHSAQRVDFNRVAAEAKPAIVSGSQSHSPQAMTIIGDTFVHYGLGNLFFDQMNEYNRREFIDRHYFYEGKYIGTELLTAMLEDYSRPRPMKAAEHYQFMEEIFKACVWED